MGSSFEYWVTLLSIGISLLLVGRALVHFIWQHIGYPLRFLWYLVFPPPLEYIYETSGNDEGNDDDSAGGGRWLPPTPHQTYAPVIIPQRSLLVPHADWWPIVTQQAKHVRLIAPTDAGKSVTAQAMLGELPGKLLIIDPLWKPGNWGGLPAVTVTPDGNYAPIAAALTALLDEMKARGAMLQHLTPGQELPVDEVIVLWDEVPDTITELSKKYNDLAGEVIRRIGQRGRHAKIKLIGMGQSDRVKAWGLEGYGDAAQNFATIYLMDKALEKRPDLLDKVERPAVLEWRGKLIPVDVSKLLPLSRRPISPARVFHFSAMGDNDDSAILRNTAANSGVSTDSIAWQERVKVLTHEGLSTRQVLAEIGGNYNEIVRLAREARGA